MASKPVFISYSSVYTEQITRLRQNLEEAGVTVWVDHFNLIPGTANWGRAIEAAIPICQAMIYIASPAAKNSDFVAHELALAKRANIPIIPFWIVGDDWLDVAPFGMAYVQYIDARTEYPAALQQLLRLLIGQATPEKAPPLTSSVVPQKPPMLTSDKVLLTLQSHTRLNAVAWSPDGTRLATANADKTAGIWDAQSGRKLLTLTGHTDEVLAVAWSPDSRRLATASADKTAGIWMALGGRLDHTLSGHRNIVTDVAWSPDGTRLATASEDTSAWLWDAQTGKHLFPLTGHKRAVTGVAWSPDGARLATISMDGTIAVWNALTGQLQIQLHKYMTHGSRGSVAWSPDGARLATVGEKSVLIWSSLSFSERPLYRRKEHSGDVVAVAWSPDSRHLATASGDTAYIWDANRKVDNPYTIAGDTKQIVGLAWSPDDTRLATASDDTVRIWELPTF